MVTTTTDLVNNFIYTKSKKVLDTVFKTLYNYAYREYIRMYGFGTANSQYIIGSHPSNGLFMDITPTTEFYKSLEKLDLESTITLITLLSQRALYLQRNPKKKSSILQIKPEIL
jgi:hypothetical protein